jgi:hypothetical protein
VPEAGLEALDDANHASGREEMWRRLLHADCSLEERLAGAERARKVEVLAREVVVIADLRMALAEARRPFWRRWLSG